MFTAARGVCSKAELKSSITQDFTRPPCPTCGGVTERNGCSRRAARRAAETTPDR